MRREQHKEVVVFVGNFVFGAFLFLFVCLGFSSVAFSLLFFFSFCLFEVPHLLISVRFDDLDVHSRFLVHLNVVTVAG